MLVVETIAKVRRAFFKQGKSIKAICRDRRDSLLENALRLVIDLMNLTAEEVFVCIYRSLGHDRGRIPVSSSTFTASGDGAGPTRPTPNLNSGKRRR